MQPYEARFAALFGPDYQAFSFWKGRVGLYAILMALEIGANDEVIVPGYTCFVVPNAVKSAGAKPTYADIALGDYNLDPRSVKRQVTHRTRAVLAQHTYGIPAAVERLRTIADKYGLYLIEDCAHVLVGSTYQGKLLGSYGKAAFFSFQWTKPYSTGLGGMVITRDKELARRLERIQATFRSPTFLSELQLMIQFDLHRRFFRPSLYWLSQTALNTLSKFGLLIGSTNVAEFNGGKPSDICWKMSHFQERAGLKQIDRVGSISAWRKSLTTFYRDTLREHGWPAGNGFDSFELLRFPLQVTARDKVLHEARRTQIEIGSWFQTPLHPLPLSKHQLINYQIGCCPIAEATAKNVINLPLHDRVTPTEAEKIIRFVLSHTSPKPCFPYERPQVVH